MHIGRAAEIRHLGEGMLYALEKFMGTGDPALRNLLKRARATLKLNIQLEQELDAEHGWVFEGQAYETFKKTCHDFLCGFVFMWLSLN